MPKIIIDIDDDYYWIIRKNGASNYIEDAVLNGTPLPKGHGKLVDVDKVIPTSLDKKSIIVERKELLETNNFEFILRYLFDDLTKLLNDMTPIIEADKE